MKDLLLENKKKLGKSIIALFCVIAMFVLMFTLSERKEENLAEKSFQESLSFQTTSTKEVMNYNFKIQVKDKKGDTISAIDKPVEGIVIKDQEKKSQDTGVQGVSIAPNSLVIPKLNVNTKVIEGIDGEAAIHEGAWLYPSSYEDDGEKIFLGHRRFWGADDPRSFWNLDHLKDGDLIYYADTKGTTYTYKVRAVSVRNAGDLAILNASKENMIKVISCSTADGSAGSAEKRIVVIATQI